MVMRGYHHPGGPMSARRRTASLGGYVVRAGDTLPAIAKLFLGDAARWRELFEANADRLASPNVLPEGLVLRLEPVAVVSDQAHPALPAPEGWGALANAWLWEIVREVGARHGVDSRLLVAIVRATSAGDPSSTGPDGRLGLLHLAPETARALGVTHPLHPRQNLDGGARYMAFLLRYFNQRLDLALGAFHAGAGAIDRYAGLPPCERTRAFVAEVMATMDVAQAA